MADKILFAKWGDSDVFVAPDGTFSAVIGDVLKSAPSWAELQDKLDRLEKAQAALKKEKIAIKVVDEKLNSYTITGINAGHGGCITSPKTSLGYSSTFAWYDCPKVRKLLTRKAAIEKELDLIHSALYSFGFPSKPGGYNSGTEERLQALKDIEQKCIAALKEESDDAS
jgi:hypothetical protein